MQPFVSVLTPTYNRRKFIPSIIECYKSQTYPKERMEWIILDDGEDCVEDLFKNTGILNLRYIRLDKKLLIGAKRNILNREAKGTILVSMDDDDYYSPERVRHVVTKMSATPSIQLAGSTELYLYFTDIHVIYKCGPYGPNHATNGTMAYRKEYANTHLYDETVTNAEEKSFLDNYKNPMIQLDPMKVMVAISHKDNTFNKIQLRTNNPLVKETPWKLNKFIKSPSLRAFFESV